MSAMPIVITEVDGRRVRLEHLRPGSFREIVREQFEMVMAHGIDDDLCGGLVAVGQNPDCRICTDYRLFVEAALVIFEDKPKAAGAGR